jgi:hypothetical protein
LLALLLGAFAVLLWPRHNVEAVAPQAQWSPVKTDSSYTVRVVPGQS